MSEQALARVDRRDRVQVVIDASTTVRHPNGWVDAWGIATRSGVLQYPEHGTAEYRPPEEVFDAASLASLRGVPLTIDHPDVGLVSAANTRALAHGWVLQVAPAPPHVRVQVRVASADALAELDRGVVELSCGYEADYASEPGTAPEDGTPYTGVQRRIRYNHLALVQLARAGHAARLTLDSRGTTMRTLKIRNLTRAIPAFLADSIAAQAAAQATRTDAAIETEEVVIGGTSLVLPKAMVESILQALGIGGGEAPPATDEKPAEEPAAPPAAGEQPPPRMDTAALATTVRAAVREALEAERADRVRADALTAQATAVLGRPPTGSDTWAVMVECVARLDDGRTAEAEQLAALARRGDLRAAGRLEGLMDGLPRADGSSPRLDRTPDLAQAIDTARRTDAGKAPVNTLDAAREKARQRKIDAGKPAPTTPAA